VELAHLVQEAVFKDLSVPIRREWREWRPLRALLKPQAQQQMELILQRLTQDPLGHLINQVRELQEQEMETVLVTTVIWRQRLVQLPIQEMCRAERRELQEMVAPMNRDKSEVREAGALEAVAAELSKALPEVRAVLVK
jgi:hypothetical protein